MIPPSSVFGAAVSTHNSLADKDLQTVELQGRVNDLSVQVENLKKDKREACEEVVKLQGQLREKAGLEEATAAQLRQALAEARQKLDRERSIVDRLLERC